MIGLANEQPQRKPLTEVEQRREDAASYLRRKGITPHVVAGSARPGNMKKLVRAARIRDGLRPLHCTAAAQWRADHRPKRV